MSEREAAEAMREAAAKVAESEDRYPQSESWRNSALTVAARIHAIPLPDQPPDPSDAMSGTDVSDAAIAEEEAGERSSFALGDFVSKKSGSKWRGCVVGTYGTALTDCGYVIKSWYEPNSVQNYPAAALEPWTPPSSDDCADATIARLSAQVQAAQAAQEARSAAEKSAIALENIASALRKNETKMQAEIDRLSKNQMPWGV